MFNVTIINIKINISDSDIYKYYSDFICCD